MSFLANFSFFLLYSIKDCWNTRFIRYLQPTYSQCCQPTAIRNYFSERPPTTIGRGLFFVVFAGLATKQPHTDIFSPKIVSCATLYPKCLKSPKKCLIAGVVFFGDTSLIYHRICTSIWYKFMQYARIFSTTHCNTIRFGSMRAYCKNGFANILQESCKFVTHFVHIPPSDVMRTDCVVGVTHTLFNHSV